MEDVYKDFAKSYDLFGPITEENAEELRFLTSVFDQHGVQEVLDCACGTGPHLYMLSKQGYRMNGSDFSAAMLAVCNQNLSKEHLTVPLKQADYRNLTETWGECRFDAVLCMTQSIAHMHNDADVLKALHSMYGVLRPGGILIMTQGTTHYTLQDKFRFDLVVNNPDFTRVFSRDIGNRFQTVHILDITHTAQESKMEQYHLTLRILLDEEFRSLTAQAGFLDVRIFGGFDSSPYDKTSSTKLIVVAQK